MSADFFWIIPRKERQKKVLDSHESSGQKIIRELNYFRDPRTCVKLQNHSGSSLISSFNFSLKFSLLSENTSKQRKLLLLINSFDNSCTSCV